MPTDVKEVMAEIEAGLPNEKDRLGDAYDCLRYSEGRFEEYPTKSKDGRWNSSSTRRTAPVMKRVMEVLSQNLYKSQPTRKLRDPKVSEWLGQVYKSTAQAPKWHRADQLTLVGGFAGFEWRGTTDPAAPVRSLLWGAHELVVWTDPDDATKPDAVATIERVDNQRRLKLYTRESVTTYVTGKGIDHPAKGNTAYRLFGKQKPAHDYKQIGPPRANKLRDDEGQGIIPFSFVHWTFPSQEFSTNGPGLNLKELNQSVNERLDRLGDAIHYIGRPVGIASGVDEAWRPPSEIKPGDFINLPPGDVDAAGSGPVPSLAYLLPDLGFVAADWTDLNNYLDHSLEMHSVPPVLIRMIQSAARSGASIQSEQLPLLAWIEARRSLWQHYEDQAAKMAVTIGAAHLGRNGEAIEASRLAAALDDWQFSIHWPALYVQLPGPDRDRADDWRLERGLVSKIGILQERYDFSEEEAFEVLLKVAQQNDRLQEIGIEPGKPNPFGGMQAGGFPPPPPPGPDQADAEEPAPEDTAAADAAPEEE